MSDLIKVNGFKIGNYKIPFKDNGNLIYNPGYPNVDKWVDNFVFDASLIYDGYFKNSTSIIISFKDILTGVEYFMSMSDFHEIINRARFNKKVVEGTFTFRKRGNTFGVKLLK